MPQNTGFESTETAIKTVAAKQPITSHRLCHYLKERRIDKNVADKYCHEVTFKVNDKDREYVAIAFKNNAGGYELRNEYFKGGNSPKYIIYLDTDNAKNINVFEGFFDFLAFQTIHQHQDQELSNFLVLNSLSFFERSFLLMEKHQGIHLFLDNDNAGRKCTSMALKRSTQYIDESPLYKNSKNLNQWLLDGLTRKPEIRQSFFKF